MPDEIIDHEIKNTGVIYEPDNANDWVFGASNIVGDVEVMPNGDWLSLNTSEDSEFQMNKNFDSYSCVTFGNLKAITALLKKVYNVDEDYSERFIAVLSNTVPGQGNSVRNVLEAIRKYGLVLEKDFPSITENMTEPEYFDRDNITEDILKKGREWLAKWEFNWETIYPSNDNIRKALKYSPVVTIGYAWAQSDGIYYDYGKSANHCFVIEKIDDSGYKYVMDTYPSDFVYDNNSERTEFIKKLSINFNLPSAHRISIKKKVNDLPIIIKFKNMAVQFVKDVHNAYYVLKDNKKQKITSWWGLLVVMAELLKPKQLSDSELGRYEDTTKFFPDK